MQTIVSSGCALLLGAASVALFWGAWISLLAMAASGILFLRGQISARRCLVRMISDLGRSLASALALIASFQFYLVIMGFGKSQGEQLAYLAGCVPALLLFLKGGARRIDSLFDPDRR
jgi:hypothetical protein